MLREPPTVVVVSDNVLQRRAARAKRQGARGAHMFGVLPAGASMRCPWTSARRFGVAAEAGGRACWYLSHLDLSAFGRVERRPRREGG